MPRKDAIKVEGVVVEVLKDGLVRVELANRHRLLAYVPGKHRANFAPASAGDKLTVEVSPYDLSKGRISIE